MRALHLFIAGEQVDAPAGGIGRSALNHISSRSVLVWAASFSPLSLSLPHPSRSHLLIDFRQKAKAAAAARSSLSLSRGDIEFITGPRCFAINFTTRASSLGAVIYFCAGIYTCCVPIFDDEFKNPRAAEASELFLRASGSY